jgi:predicted glycoside hydrolase/deacetylase ChbG (UPF0249 family)
MIKKILIAGYLLMQIVPVLAQNKTRLLVRGDDMGFAHAANQALIKAYKEGIERSIEVIVPSPWFPEAVKLLEENKDVDVGIHLALTSEWENVKWRPLTYCPSLTDSSGYFFPMLWPNKNYGNDRALTTHAWKIEEVEKEFRAQIELALKKIPRISHVSAHMGCTEIDKKVSELVKKLVKEYGIEAGWATGSYSYTGYKGPSKTSAEKLSSFLNMLDHLEPGKTYMFVDHPALDGPEMRAIYHTGYENVAEDRQGVVDVWTHPRVKEAIRKKGIELISYKDLH